METINKYTRGIKPPGDEKERSWFGYLQVIHFFINRQMQIEDYSPLFSNNVPSNALLILFAGIVCVIRGGHVHQIFQKRLEIEY